MKVKNPNELLMLAREIPEREHEPLASEYVNVVHELRERGLTWREVDEFFDTHGFDFRGQTLRAAYFRLRRKMGLAS